MLLPRRDTDVARLLLAHDADTGLKNDAGKTALQIVQHTGYASRGF
jgi:hypothetical protein